MGIAFIGNDAYSIEWKSLGHDLRDDIGMISTLHNSRTHIQERKVSQRNEFRRTWVYYPFRGIHIAVEAFSPKMSPKIVQSRDDAFRLKTHSCKNIGN
jgi:hypothetical protein